MDAVEEIKSRLSVEDVVGEYVQLKRAGRNFRGLSPFTSEKTASLMVSPEKQIWHDFSSGKGGDIFSFIMEMEGVDFKTTLEILARKAGVELTQYGGGGDGKTAKHKERLYAALDLAAKFYQTQLKQHQVALTYLIKTRAFSKEIILAFQLGYAPNTGNALLSFLLKRGFSRTELQQAGLITRSYRPQDMFRARIMIPLADPQGRIIGFTARLLADEPNSPKYLNTPQTILYDKSRHIFGLHLAKEAIRKAGYVVMVEGNLDVIASHKAVVSQVVATAGTALTERQLKLLANLTQDIRLAFDQDKAGQAATERAIPIASRVGINLNVIDIPSGKDPDELIKLDPKAWEFAINNYSYAIDWLIAKYSSQLDLTQATGKKRFSDILVPLISGLLDPVEIDHYLSQLAELLAVDKRSLLAKARGVSKTNTVLKKPKVASQAINKSVVEQTKYQDQLLALTLLNLALRVFIEPIEPDMLVSQNAKDLLSFLKTNPDFNGDPLTVRQLSKLSDYVKILLLQYEAIYQDLEQAELAYEAKRLQDRLITIYVKLQKAALSDELIQANQTKTQQLLEKAKMLDSLLKRT
jgi:DNA primase